MIFLSKSYKDIKFISSLFKIAPLKSLQVIFWNLAASIMEGLGILTIIPILSVVDVNIATSNNFVLNFTKNIYDYLNFELNILNLCIGIFLIISTKAALSVYANKKIGEAVAFVTANYRIKLISAITKANWSYVSSQKLGSFSSGIGIESERVASAFHTLMYAVSHTLQVVVYTFIAFAISWKLCVIVLLSSFILTFIGSFFINRFKKFGYSQSHSYEILNKKLISIYNSYKPIKAMGMEESLSNALKKMISKIQNIESNIIYFNGYFKYFPEVFIVFCLCFYLYIMVMIFNFNVASLFIMFILFYRSLNRFVELYRVYQNLLLLMGFMDKLETKISLAESSSEKVFGELFEEKIYQILYKNVTFSYGSKIILKNLNLSIFKNQITLIKGASGVGKTTMLDLLIGLYKVKEGQIIINKKNINDINLLKWRQNKIGYVPQDSELFEGTLLENITLNRKNISAKDAHDAAIKSGLKEIVENQDSLNMIIEEKGGNLSGGQRQRISIARALIKKPEILILDEITSSLDEANMKIICNLIVKLKNDTTILLISHEKELDFIADKIYQLEEIQ